jgi:hypothetical protein
MVPGALANILVDLRGALELGRLHRDEYALLGAQVVSRSRASSPFRGRSLDAADARVPECTDCSCWGGQGGALEDRVADAGQTPASGTSVSASRNAPFFYGGSAWK